MTTNEQAAPEGGSYEVIRQRLLAQAGDLAGRAEKLNAERKRVFGGTELTLLATDRVRTENNAVARDLVSIGGYLVVGYQVVLGMKAEVRVSDLFSLHQAVPTAEGMDLLEESLAEGGTSSAAAAFLLDPAFVKELKELFRYTKDARLLQLRRTDTRLLAVFQVGASTRDVKVFRWSIDAQGRLKYLDARGDEDHVRPRAHDFAWKPTTRENQVKGKFPHISVLDEVFVETVGGDLTIKVENNTLTGEGIYREPVDDPNQSLDDADIQYAKVGSLLLLRIKPFREQAYRYFVFNPGLRTVLRADTIAEACLALPEDQGVLFPDGYALATGESKRFEGAGKDLFFERVVKSPNGEDVLYVFHRVDDGAYYLLPYNLIRKEVANPTSCHGYSLFDDGRMVVVRAQTEPTRVHPVQVWRTPFTSAEHAAQAPTDGSYLSKVGNAELVRGISDSLSLRRLASTEQPSRTTFEDAIRGAQKLIDQYYWLGHAEVGDLAAVVRSIQKTAEAIVDEFVKVEAIRSRASSALSEAREKQRELLTTLRATDLASVEAFMKALTSLRTQRGHLHTLRELKFMDLAAVDALEKEAIERYDETSRGCVTFLLGKDALKPLLGKLDGIVTKSATLSKSAELAPLATDVEQVGAGLSVLTEIGASLKVDDPTIRTRILEAVSEAMSQLNRARATVQARDKDLRTAEGRAEFVVQFKLFGQTVSSALAVCDSPERCDQELSKVMVALEELEGRFGELDEFVPELAQKRGEVGDAFQAKRQALLDERQRRVGAIVTAADRIVQGVARRARTFTSPDELNTFFASDPMVAKLRELAAQLLGLGDSVKADEVESRLKSARQDALRALRDRADLMEGGEALIKLGRHRFHVNTQGLELSLLPRGEHLCVHLTGTDFFERIDDPALEAARELWDQQLVSETAEVYRAEYLAFLMLDAAERAREGLSLEGLTQASVGEGGLLGAVRVYSAERHEEGYERGVHDHDATLVLERLLAMRKVAGRLRYESPARALAVLAWAGLDDAQRQLLSRRGRSVGRLREKLAEHEVRDRLARELEPLLHKAAAEHRLATTDAETRVASRYLVEELAKERVRFATSEDAIELKDAFLAQLDLLGTRAPFDDDLRQLERHPAERLELALAWLEAFVTRSGKADVAHLVREAAVILVTERKVDREPSAAVLDAKVTGLLGQHPRIVERSLHVRFDELLSRVGRFVEERAPRFRAYRKLRTDIAERERRRLRLDEFKPRVLTSFVRNRLVDEVYLPLVGANLAKQLGAAGAGKRTDLMGLLLLVSPPGYGKTTLMEYVASKLGLVFMKVNGPALGHEVKSLDPREAPNATARQEVEKINLALEMGNNVMLYLDDIQHTHPELLQKFISLCDAQRRVEGVWGGRTRTYDLRGKKFCIAMAGNPYTETGAKFQIPDMLANRADTYNLGDILEGKDDLFALSYLENALTSNPVLAPLSGRAPADLHKLIRMAQGEDVASSELAHPYSAAEVTEIVAVLARLLKVQRVLLQVNLQYIQSAAQDDAFRTEPPFKLQGSYRNMNKMAEKVVAAHTDAEIERLIDDHYAGESQTLTTGAEQNLLKLGELRGRLAGEAELRWNEIKGTYARQKRMGGKTDDPVVRVVGTLAALGEDLQGIRAAVESAIPEQTTAEALGEKLGPTLAELATALGLVARPQLEVKLPAGEGTAKVLAERLGSVEGALAPLARAAAEGDATSRALQGTLKRLHEVLDALRAELAKGLVAQAGAVGVGAAASPTWAAPTAHAMAAPAGAAPPAAGASHASAHAAHQARPTPAPGPAAGLFPGPSAGVAISAPLAAGPTHQISPAAAHQAGHAQPWAAAPAPAHAHNPLAPASAAPSQLAYAGPSTAQLRPPSQPPQGAPVFAGAAADAARSPVTLTRPATKPPQGEAAPATSRVGSASVAPAADAPMLRFEVDLGADTPSNFYSDVRGSKNIVDDGGVFVATFRKLPRPGVTLRVLLRFAGGTQFECYAVVENAREAELGRPEVSPGFGARLVSITPQQRAAIDRFVAQRAPFSVT
jgi:hypothetical protein